MNTRTNPNYPFKKRNYNRGSGMLFKPLERAARIADAEIKKSKKKKVISQENTKERNNKTNKKQWNISIAIIAFLVLFFAISIPTGFINSYGSIIALIIGVVFSIVIGAAIPIED